MFRKRVSTSIFLVLRVFALWLLIGGPFDAFAAADPTAPDMTTVDAAFTYGEKNYFFYSKWYYRYHRGSSEPDPGYPALISHAWKGLPKAFQSDLDAVFLWSQKKVYFFKDDEFLRYNMKENRVDEGYPKKIKNNWPGLWGSDIDAAMYWPGNKKVYFFKGNEVKRFNFEKNKTEATEKIGKSWKGVWSDGVDAALKWDGKKSYFFNGQQYVRYSNKADKVEKGYPKDIEKVWRFSQGQAYKPIKRKTGPKCGGRGEKVCGFASATFIAKAREKCPSGSFWDPTDGGSCYRCPSNYGRAIIHPVTSAKACWRPGRVGTKHAHHKRKTPWVWECKRHEFWDPNGGGGCWTCPGGYGRTVYHVASKRACAKWSKGSSKKAAYLGGVPCPSGSVLDLGRGKAECWSCPSGYIRAAVTPADKPQACIAEHPCHSGEVAVGNPVSGFKCEKKGACGSAGQRPCVITERLLPCNRGLGEDFVANKCVDAKIAACLAGVRTIRLGMVADHEKTKLQHEAAKLAENALKEVAKDIPGLKKALGMADSERKRLVHDVGKAVSQNLDKALPGLRETAEKILVTLEDIEKAFNKGEKRFMHLLSSDEFCTMGNRERGHKLKEVINIDFSKIKFGAADPEFWHQFADFMPITPAHASILPDFSKVNYILGLSLVAQRNYGIFGYTAAWGYAPYKSEHQQWAMYLGPILGATTDIKPDFELLPFLKLEFGDKHAVEETVTASVPVVINFGEMTHQKRGKYSLHISPSFEFRGEKEFFALDGIMFYPWLAQKRGRETELVIEGDDVHEDFTDQTQITVGVRLYHLFKLGK